MKKYILYSFLTIFAFSTASFGVEDDEEDIPPPNVLKIRYEEIPWDLFLEVGRPGGLSPQTHQNPDKNFNPSDPCYTRGTTFYIPEKKFHELFSKPIPKSH
ncbi:MAG: hypothetical protein K2Y08_07620 [Alphaproteobacteria bacterium]|nr:hypothetical protein [Alphaproteobacteria bacterium]